MNPEKIKLLLEKYYNGESSLEEENKLKEYFMQKEIHGDLKAEQDIFRYYVQSSGIPEPSSGFETRIISAIDSLDNNEGRLKTRKIYITLSGIAAALFLLIGTYLFLNDRSELRDTYSDPEIAYAEAIRILYDVSERLNQGTRALEPLNLLQRETRESLKTINRSTSTIKEKMEPINDMFEVMGEKIDTNY